MTMRSVLYIEDQALEGEVIGRLFQQVFRRVFKGEVEFTVVPRLDSARISIPKLKPSAILMDLGLPDSLTKNTSTEVLRELVPISPPIIVLTGNPIDTENLRKTCFANGCEDFMLKQDAHRHPEELSERVYCAYLRRLYRDGARS